MRHISNTPGPLGYGETSWEAGGIGEVSPGKTFSQELIGKANTVPLTRIFKHYGLRITETHYSVVCPFKTHKGGRESTASFRYYPDTNTFNCYGCNVGGYYAHGVEFVAAYDGISKFKAAQKIMSLFQSDVDGEAPECPDNSEKLEMMMEFSTTVREFRSAHIDDKAESFVENICLTYDTVMMKHKLDNSALRRIIDELKLEMESYSS